MKFDGYICDICGRNIYNRDKRFEITATKPVANSVFIDTIDLCGCCSNMMIEWIKNNKPKKSMMDKIIEEEGTHLEIDEN